jgi:hypothetical protein
MNAAERSSPGLSAYRTLRISARLPGAAKRESDMASRREAANHEAQTQE